MAPLTDRELGTHLRKMLGSVWTAGELGDQYALLLRAPEDPYPLYEKIRERGPLHRSRLGVWVTGDHTLGTKVLRDRRFGIRTAAGEKTGPEVSTFDNSFLGMDPPDHTRLRRLATPFLSPSGIDRFRPVVERVCHALLDKVDADAPFDLMEEFATQLPITVIGELFGVTDEHWERFLRHGRGVCVLLDGISSVQQRQEVQTAVDGLAELFGELVELRAKEPGEDMISHLLAARDEGTVSTGELVAMCGMLSLAGTETTVNLIGNGVLALLEHPEQWELLRADPALASNVVEEALRYDTSVQQSDRVAHEDLELGGEELPVDSRVVVLTGAANRDPEVYPEPDRFDITRTVKPEHLSFSGGRHYCLGAPLARLEAEIAFRVLTTRMGALKQAGAVVRRRSPIVRGLLEFPVTASA